MTIDHKTCGHVNHTTLDGSRHEDMHTAIFDLIQKWSTRANQYENNTKHARSYDSAIHQGHLRDLCKSMIDDLVKAMHTFEVEQ